MGILASARVPVVILAASERLVAVVAVPVKVVPSIVPASPSIVIDAVPTVRIPVILASPRTCSFAPGASVPIPTEPVELILLTPNALLAISVFYIFIVAVP